MGQELRAPGLHHVAASGAHRHSCKGNDPVGSIAHKAEHATSNPDIPNIPNTPELGVQLSFGPARPVVLFPVRVETRFFPQADGSAELRVRVYPDRVQSIRTSRS